MQSIHCKASLDDQNRRFLFKFSPLFSESGAATESQFNKLQNQIRTLYGFGGNFVLKYKDDEGDHIFIECDEELNCAVAQSAGLLRLFIKLKDELVDVTTTTTSTTTTPTTRTTTTVVSTVSTLPSENTCPNYYGRHGHHGRGGYHGRGNGHGNWHGRHGHEHGHDYCHGHGKHSSQYKAEKLTSKREFFASLLNDPHTDEFRKVKLQRKLECIDRRLATDNAINQQEGSKYESSTSSGDEKWRKKKCDKYRKKYEKNGKKPSKIRRNLTEDDKVMLKVLKTQIWELKPTLNSVKIQLGEKKALKADAKNKGDVQRAEELKKEIKQLKEIKKEHKKAVAPLKDQIRAIKFEKQDYC